MFYFTKIVINHVLVGLRPRGAIRSVLKLGTELLESVWGFLDWP